MSTHTVTHLLLVGTYTTELPHVRGEGSGVYGVLFDSNSGRFCEQAPSSSSSKAHLLSVCENPSFLITASLCQADASVDHTVVLVAHEQERGDGHVSVYDSEALLSAASAQDCAAEHSTATLVDPLLMCSSHGVHPCHLSAQPLATTEDAIATGMGTAEPSSPTSTLLVRVANYAAGTTSPGSSAEFHLSITGTHTDTDTDIATGTGTHTGRCTTSSITPCALRMDHVRTRVLGEKGSGVVASRQAGTHAHFNLPLPQRKGVALVDLGTDRVLCYAQDSDHLLTQWTMPPGSGPRFAVLNAAHRLLYVALELSSEVAVCPLDEDRILQRLSTLPAANSTASTVAHIAQVGHLLLLSNRGHDSVCVFRIDPASGLLSFVRTVPSGGTEPRHFEVVDQRWLLVANQNSNLLCVYRVDQLEGDLDVDSGHASLPTLIDQISVPTPVCITPLQCP
mmetsp:Transcript_42929/g.108383  ORF Transcript_42929/g.108383 Transcript_42929/m.108383 type:complete len:451 (-) Transcript_42929:19-1371(-)|eukprot:CAMPEP_0177639768 /NCGR_PEP_ID=MMETSP0447-20121125/6194_1 /TAXON_ID=0 /ORGANISM="Stygamoeba regulata, Strain BSH-02190019" /LENGTH=450 /DNA_ID=CAMNT_0019141811 /DNA_START=47 /DNA_END=1399 /DNA_ORIENTATION=+